MSRNTSLTFREAVFSQGTDKAILLLLELDHPDWVDPIRVTSNAVDTVNTIGTFVPYPFKIELPSDESDSLSVARIEIDNIHRDLTLGIRQISSPPLARMMVVLSDSPDTLEADFNGYELRNIKVDDFVAQGDLCVEGILEEPIPGDSYSSTQFAGLVS